MSEKSKKVEERIKGLEVEAERLVVKLLDVAAQVARESHWALLPAMMSAAAYVEAARSALSDPRRGASSGGSTGPIVMPPAGGGGIKA